MALSGSQQTSLSIRHEVTCWENGDYWSHVSAHDDHSNQLFRSLTRMRGGDDTVPDYEQHEAHRHTLADQYVELMEFVASNRGEVAA